MNFIKKTIIEKINQYNKISLFFHEVPDFDALGSCYALKHFIKDIAPEKEVRIIGLDILDDSFSKKLFEFDHTHVSNTFVSQSLGIILDTANEQRIWTNRHRYCKETIRIDHHPQVESICNVEWIDPNYPATCEMIAELLFDWNSKYVLSPTAMYLYAGIVTDTGRFLHLNTRPSTFAIASKLLSTGFNRQRINDVLYIHKFKEIKFNSYVISKTTLLKRHKFAYAVLGKKSFDRFGIDVRMSMVQMLNNIEGVEVWMSCYYDETKRAWRGSLRSRSLPINQIAEKHNGGGHKLAAGFTLKSKHEIKVIKKEIINYLKQFKQDY